MHFYLFTDNFRIFFSVFQSNNRVVIGNPEYQLSAPSVCKGTDALTPALRFPGFDCLFFIVFCGFSDQSDNIHPLYSFLLLWVHLCILPFCTYYIILAMANQEICRRILRFYTKGGAGLCLLYSIYESMLISFCKTFGNIPNFFLSPQIIYFTHFSSKIKYALSEYGIINIPNYEVSFLEITLTFAGFERGQGYVSGCYGKASEMFSADLLPL